MSRPRDKTRKARGAVDMDKQGKPISEAVDFSGLDGKLRLGVNHMEFEGWTFKHQDGDGYMAGWNHVSGWVVTSYGPTARWFIHTPDGKVLRANTHPRWFKNEAKAIETADRLIEIRAFMKGADDDRKFMKKIGWPKDA